MPEVPTTSAGFVYTSANSRLSCRLNWCSADTTGHPSMAPQHGLTGRYNHAQRTLRTLQRACEGSQGGRRTRIRCSSDAFTVTTSASSSSFFSAFFPLRYLLASLIFSTYGEEAEAKPSAYCRVATARASNPSQGSHDPAGSRGSGLLSPGRSSYNESTHAQIKLTREFRDSYVPLTLPCR